jgi:cellulase/cellobiase CelA1
VSGGDCQDGICSGNACQEPGGAGPGGGLSTELGISTDWGGGYCATLNVTNESTAIATSFTVTLDTNQSTIYSFWNGNFSGSSGEIEVTPCCPWNSSLAPGETDSSLGFCANRAVSGNALPLVIATSGAF